MKAIEEECDEVMERADYKIISRANLVTLNKTNFFCDINMGNADDQPNK